MASPAPAPPQVSLCGWPSQALQPPCSARAAPPPPPPPPPRRGARRQAAAPAPQRMQALIPLAPGPNQQPGALQGEMRVLAAGPAFGHRVRLLGALRMRGGRVTVAGLKEEPRRCLLRPCLRLPRWVCSNGWAEALGCVKGSSC